jgi:pSer/pThr/pTyr-binding forkhead associated (FHA) protein
MAIKLTITEESDPSSEYERSFIQDRVVFGRSRSADVCLPAMAVSTRHAEIRLAGADYAIVDLESLNGTSVNNTPVLAYRNKTLKNGDIIAIANFRIQFHLGVPTPTEESRDTAVKQARNILANLLARSGQASETHSLYIQSGPSRGTRIELSTDVAKVLIGRGKHVDLYVDDPDVSRQHAEVVVEAAGVFVRDLKSRNGILVDGQRVDAVKLELGTQFTIGSSTFVLEHPAEKSLGHIFEAPEEETASFMLTRDRASTSDMWQGDASPTSNPTPDIPDDKSESPDATLSLAPAAPTIGPSDPLIDPDDKGGKHPRSTLETSAPRTDIGLIVVGSLILIAAVAGLIYLFR